MQSSGGVEGDQCKRPRLVISPPKSICSQAAVHPVAEVAEPNTTMLAWDRAYECPAKKDLDGCYNYENNQVLNACRMIFVVHCIVQYLENGHEYPP